MAIAITPTTVTMAKPQAIAVLSFDASRVLVSVPLGVIGSADSCTYWARRFKTISDFDHRAQAFVQCGPIRRVQCHRGLLLQAVPPIDSSTTRSEQPGQRPKQRDRGQTVGQMRSPP